MNRQILNQLSQWKTRKNRKPLVLMGARQVGKTYTLKEFGKKEFSNVHYFNFELDKKLKDFFKSDIIPKRIIQDLAFYADSPISFANDLVIFDEIQECPAALTSLKYFAEDFSSLAVCAAGSHIGLSLSTESFPVGKVDILKMYPLSFSEFLLALDDKRALTFLNSYQLGEDVSEVVHQHLFRQFKTYLVVGGLPEVVCLFSDQQNSPYEALQAVRAQQNILITSYLKDVAKHSGKVNAMYCERVLQNVPAQLARSQDGSAKKFIFKGVVPGQNRYAALAGPIDWLVTAGLVLKTPLIDQVELPLKAHTKENNFKLYLFDVGILGALGGLSPKTIWEYDFGTYKGFVVENFVAQELTVSGISDFFAWANNTSEIEFVFDLNGNVIPLEVKSGHVTHSRSLGVFVQKNKPQSAYVLSLKQPARHRAPIRGAPLYAAGQLKGKLAV